MLVNQVPCPLTEDPERSEAVPPIYCQLHWINYSGPSGRGRERFIHKKETTWSSWKHISFLISLNTPLALSWPTWRLGLLWNVTFGDLFRVSCSCFQVVRSPDIWRQMTWGAESQSAVYSAGNGSSRRALREKPANMNKKWPLGEHICTWRTFLYLENIFALKELICDRFSFHL